MTVCDNLGAYADGNIDPADAAAFRAHLAECPTCPEELVATMQMLTILSMAGGPGDGPGVIALTLPVQSPARWRWSWLWMRWEVTS